MTDEIRSLDDLVRSAEPPPPRRKLLVVDDKPEVVDGIRTSRLAKSYEIVTATNGREGLEALAADREIGVMLLDMLMPVMGGEEFLKELRGHPDRYGPYIRVIVYTAFAGRGVDQARILKEYGPIRFLTKATDPAVIEAEVRNAYTEYDTEVAVRLDLERAHRELLEAERTESRALTLEKTVGGMTHAVVNWLDPVRRYLENAMTMLPPSEVAESLKRKLESIDETVATLEERLREVSKPFDDLLTQLSADLTDAYAVLHTLPRSEDLMARLVKALRQLDAANQRIQRIKEYAIVAHQPRTDEVDPRELCESVVAPYVEQYSAISFHIHGDAGNTFACAGGQVREALQNLLTNAIRAVRNSPRKIITVTYELRSVPGGVVLLLIIEDTGEGVSEALREKILQPFVSGHKTEGGSGLGLAYVEQVCLNHGGRLAFESTPGQGAKFTMELNARRVREDGGVPEVPGD